jgi:hypothetical protein
VYLAFGFEGIDNAADREQLMSRALDWLISETTDPPVPPNPPAGSHVR